MVRTLDEIKEKIKVVVGDRADDDTISLLEDVEDTYTMLSAGDGTDWKMKYEENDAEWRRRYKERFYGGGSQEDFREEPEEEIVDEKTKYEELFEEG